MSYKRHDDGNTNTNTNRQRRWKERNHYERHYCEVCNVWLAADRQSILHHEQGAQHQTKLQQATIVKRETTAREEKEQQLLQASLQRMEAAAMASTFGQDYGRFAAVAVTATAASTTTTSPSTSTTSTSNPSSTTTTTTTTTTAQASKSEWEERKRQREEEKRVAAKARAKEKRRASGNGGSDEDDPDDDNDEFSKRRKVAIGEHEGSYELDGVTWLEGVTFGDLFEIDMPIQFWRGGANCTDAELQLPGNALHWQDAIIAAVRQRPNEPQRADRIVLDVAYLEMKRCPHRQRQQQQQPVQDNDDEDKEEERIQKSVPLRHARIRLGNPADERIPETLLEARLLAMGGEEIQVIATTTDDDNAAGSEIDQATGFSGWRTVAIKRTTVRNEQKIQRDALRQQKREAEQQAKETEARRMEQAKVANADDSALGAFDIWNRTAKGYKGVDIHNAQAAVVQVQDLAKKVAEGPVAFKKKKTTAAAANKKQSRRTTSADD